MNSEQTPARKVTLYSLAVVGFVALIACSMWLAVYSTRYVPAVVNKIGGAAVYLSSLFTPSDATLTVVPPEAATSTPVTSTSTPSVVPEPVVTAVTPQPVVLSGLPDLAITFATTGYLTTTENDSFVASSTAPANTHPAIKFTVKNIGTNVSGPWRFSTVIPTQTNFIYQSPIQQTLRPGESIDYTLGFDHGQTGANQTISVTVNFDNAISEAHTDNNTIVTQLTIL